jgi:transcriptional regulator with GAF, ATPase, and Fis domain
MSRTPDDAATIPRGVAGFLATSAQFVLEVIEGPDRGARVLVEPLSPSRVLIGKSEACALRLSDPSASRRHAALSVEGAELHLADLRSTNGTFVGGLRVAEAFLRGGEVISIGGSRIAVARASDVNDVKEDMSGPDRFGPLLGASPQMRRLYPLLERLSHADVPVVIEGETGTGKEVVAEAIHAGGPRAEKPFVVFDCTAVAPSLLEAALFGHERGAFTGAMASHKGVFEEANGGTLLIDEIGDLELSLQSKLLRAVQKREVRRVGGDRWIRVDVRVLAATRRDLDREVQAGRFREDLFYRLAVARVELPPLRDRTGDVALLARAFWDRLGGREQPIPYELFSAWEDHAWPGNVRELENTVARRLALGELAPPLGVAPPGASGGPTSARAPASVPRPGPGPGRGARIEVPFDIEKPLAVTREIAVQELERRYVEQMLAAFGGRTAEAAAKAGVTRRYLNMLRARFGI